MTSFGLLIFLIVGISCLAIDSLSETIDGVDTLYHQDTLGAVQAIT